MSNRTIKINRTIQINRLIKNNPLKKINLNIKVPRFVQYTAAGISALAFGWYLFQQIAGRRDRRKYPPSGRLVEVGGFKLHFLPSGQGEPVVVLESGSGGFSLDWNQIQPQVAQVTRVCSYDRAGHGWSGASPRPHSIPNVVQDLHTLLESTRQKPPYLLVAHSLGGVYANYFARRYPSEVAGIIFVDAVHPEIYDHLPQVYHRQTQFELSKRWLSATSGLMRLGVLKPPAEGEAGRQRSALALRPAMWRAALDQNRHLRPGTDQMIEAAGPFPPIPVLVLAPEDNTWLADITPDLPATWRAGQEKLAALSPQGRLQMVAKAGHDLLNEQPGLVTQSILAMVAQLRA